MFGKTSHLNPLASRKKLLLAESELNRARLVQDWQTMAGEVQALADQVQTLRSLATAAATLVAGVASLRRKKSGTPVEKPSWWKTILKGAQMAGSVLLGLRASAGATKDK